MQDSAGGSDLGRRLPARNAELHGTPGKTPRQTSGHVGVRSRAGRWQTATTSDRALELPGRDF